MEEKLPCDIHTEQIKTLFKRVDNVENKIDDMTDMKIAINTISVSMEHIVEHNKRQDGYSKRQDELNERQNRTLENINTNLNELNEGQRSLNGKVEKLEQRVDENESKHSIDLRDIEKKKYMDIFIKYILPTGGGLIVLLELLKIWKG